MAVKKLSILGSTGSIGRQALSLTEDLGIEVTAISCNSNIELLEEQALRHNPGVVCVVDEDAALTLKERLKTTGTRVLSGKEGLLETAMEEESDTLLNAIVGIAGLEPTLRAIESKKNIALANKETLVAAGALVMGEARKHGVRIFPVDSEHSAIFQCLEGAHLKQFRRIFLTASGGPFFGRTLSELRDVTPQQALNHPNWRMGNKISVDSATLMNKGLEFIEAMWLFDAVPEQIEIVVHRQSIIHSMVEFCDYSVIAQLSLPDMRIPIQYALSYPGRASSAARPLSVEAISKLTFERPDTEVFCCLEACVEAAKKGGLAPAMVNAANEIAVRLFLEGKISFIKIGEIAKKISSEAVDSGEYTLEDVLLADGEARRKVESILGM
ncbi:MAG: 1-deoxy-D-xylulose-5-phosphate reductoisomerase [Oscillospiraceae bacterium]|nr:1-deoxy-D-xylulose-5-phosphate reductoisomerase [Oscillospiraceae bacterium]